MSADLISVDTSALCAVLFVEPDANLFSSVLARSAGVCVMSAPTLVEVEMVIDSRLGAQGTSLLASLIEEISLEIVPFDAELARIAGAGWRRFGRGRHEARLNLGDCFAYALSKKLAAPLLYKGDDFSRTDVASAL